MSQQPGVRYEKELCYAIVELVGELGTANSIEKGLFKGIKEGDEGDEFLWIKSGNSVSKACSLMYYNVLSIETYDSDVRTFVFFMAGEGEQKMAREVLDKILSKFNHIPDEKDPGLIDVNKFTNVPTNFGSHSSVNTASKPVTHAERSAPIYSNIYHRSGTATSAYVRKEPEPFPFKRETRKPTKVALRKMGEKLDLIMKGEYKYELPRIDKKADRE